MGFERLKVQFTGNDCDTCLKYFFSEPLVRLLPGIKPLIFPGIPDHCDLNETGFVSALEYEIYFEAGVPLPDKENINSVALYFFVWYY